MRKKVKAGDVGEPASELPVEAVVETVVEPIVPAAELPVAESAVEQPAGTPVEEPAPPVAVPPAVEPPVEPTVPPPVLPIEQIESPAEPAMSPLESRKPESGDNHPTKQKPAFRINWLLTLTVIVPTLLSAIYYGLIASDVYISESRFVVRSPQRQQATGLGAILQGAGFSRAQDDTYTVHDFMLSRDALRQLDQQLGLAKSFGSSSVDRISRFAGLDTDRSFEALHRYYQKRVGITHDTASSISTLRISTFSPEDAQRINLMLLEMGEKLVNQLSERGRQDVMRFAAAEVALAETKVRNSAQALSSYRNRKGVFDPEKQSALQLQQVSKLQDELIASRTQLAQIKSAARNNPQISALQVRIDTLKAVIDEENAKVTGGQRSLTDKASEFEKLALERTFAEKQLAAALSSLEQARNDAQRKQFYLERIVQPVKPDVAVEPKRLRAVLATFAVGMICWGILTMLLAGVREHHD
jgi:capsular polysaccharide transport system permease protein